MAPDKIYVTESIYGNTMMQVADEESVEYINMDTLLEWVEHMDEIYPADAFQMIIDKINSL